jgi:uncharacterized caspase-like protein
MNVSSSRATPLDEPDPEYRNDRIAVVIRIGRYNDPKIPTLNYAVDDAEEFYKVLVDRKRGRFNPANVQKLTGPEATKLKIERVIGRWLPEQVTNNPGATAIIFFVGHGECEADPFGEEADGYAKYLLPVDVDSQDLRFTALASPYFTKLLTGVNAKGLVIFLDACFAGAVAEGATARGDLPASFDISPIQKRLEAAVASKSGTAQASTVIIAAARSSQLSYEHETLKHGVFTHHLIEALRGKADSNSDGYIGVREVYQYLEKTVPETVTRLTQKVQKPVMNLPLDNAPDFILAEDVSRLEEIKLEKRTATLEGLFRTKKLTRKEFFEASQILEERSPARLYENLIRLLEGEIQPEIYREILGAILRDDSGGDVAPALVQQTSSEPAAPVEAAATPEQSEPSVKWPWKTIVQTIIGALIVGAVGFGSLYGMLFSPRIDMVARDVDWEPRNPKIGQVVTFTGKFSAVYRVRQGLRWSRDEVAGKEQADIFTATWSIDGRQTDIVEPRKIKTGEIVDTRFETTFQTPGNYTIGFSIKSRSLDADASNDTMMRTISILASD